MASFHFQHGADIPGRARTADAAQPVERRMDFSAFALVLFGCGFAVTVVVAWVASLVG